MGRPAEINTMYRFIRDLAGYVVDYELCSSVQFSLRFDQVA